MEIFDLSTLITIAIAVFVFLRLRSVLGTRTGHERPPQPRRNGADRPLPKEMEDVSNDNVVTLPNRRKNADGDDASGAVAQEIDAIAKPRTKLNKALKQIHAADQRFQPAQFVSGAEMAY